LVQESKPGLENALKPAPLPIFEMPKKRADKSISVFFPAYGDEGSIAKMVEGAISVVRPRFKDFEVIVVDDGGPDRSGEIADELAKKYKQVKVVHHKKNKGYGGALKSGFRTASKDLIFYTDGDAQFDAKELVKLLPFIDEYDMVNGYKMGRADNIVRIIAGRLYNFGSRLLFGLPNRDVDCDFRLFNRHVIDSIKLESDTGLICVEMMKKIGDKKFTIKEVPVHHYPRLSGGSQFFKPKRVILTLIGWARLWWKLVLGKKLGLVKN
jgi:glycosyltransferase involved in cell wall biosynthesis